MTPSSPLSREEFEVVQHLRLQVVAYEQGGQGSPEAVARWLRILADKLDPPHGSPQQRSLK